MFLLSYKFKTELTIIDPSKGLINLNILSCKVNLNFVSVNSRVNFLTDN